MSFFEALPDPPAEPEPAEEQPEWVVPEWLGPSEHVAGGLVPFRAPFVHDHRLCIRLDRVEAFPAGLLLQLELHMVDEVSGGRYVSGLFPWAVIDRGDPGRLLHRDYRVAPDDLLRFGVQYRDGRSVATRSIHEFQHQHGEHAGAEQPPDHPVLVAGQGGRGGGGRRASMSLWVWPLPPIGEDLVLLVQWLVFGIQQASVTIPGAAITAGHEDIDVLWPESEGEKT